MNELTLTPLPPDEDDEPEDCGADGLEDPDSDELADSDGLEDSGAGADELLEVGTDDDELGVDDWEEFELLEQAAVTSPAATTRTNSPLLGRRCIGRSFQLIAAECSGRLWQVIDAATTSY